ncbi:tetratricopeptide repeat protein [Actinoplanes philippinensis]|uniref:tetratricopeptide repeat protein n=1 Tax=Actinoplanes philippinensis TaxID=35752 RepID=UPI0033D6F565
MTWTAYEQGRLAVDRRDYGAARELLREAGADAAAMLLLGQLAGAGLGGPVDPEEKQAWYERAAALGSAEAAYNLGAIHAGAGRHAEGLAWYLRAAELGDGGGLRMAGVMYATGQGVPADDREAERLLLAAAERVPEAAFDLGALYAYRRDDPAAAARWYLEAAKEDGARALEHLEALVPRLRESAATSTRARTMLGVILAFHLGEQAAATALLADTDGDPEALRSLAFLIASGPEDRRDTAKATALYRMAADAGDGYAAHNLGVTATDPRAAVRWLRQAAESGVHESIPHLANRLSELDIDDEALRWYVRGAEAGHTGCMFAAACWYRDGFGGPVDRVRALRWYLTLLGTGNGDALHEAHQIVALMSDDEIREAGRLSGRLTDAEVFLARRRAA